MIVEKKLLIEYMNKADQEGMLRLYFANQCVGVLEKIKPANLIIIPRGNWRLLRKIRREHKLSSKVLYRDKERLHVLLYNRSSLKCYLRQIEVSDFLSERGYESHVFFLRILQLMQRMKKYHEGKKEFPHEIGIFLGYPLADVKGYIEHNGLECLEQGYWKVYQRNEQTKLQFRQMDEARYKMIYDLFYSYGMLE